MTRATFNDWWWMPKIVSVFDTSEICTIYSAIKDGRISSEANRFILESGFLLPSKESRSLPFETNWLKHEKHILEPFEDSCSILFNANFFINEIEFLLPGEDSCSSQDKSNL